jgi:putative transposase
MAKNDGNGKVRLMFQDEASFGRISKIKDCWCPKEIRPCVPCHYVREYRYAFGAVEPMTGESFFTLREKCNTISMNDFLQKLSDKFSNDKIILVCDGAGWHKSKDLAIPDNIKIMHIPPYTPEMNPIEQIWKEIRKIGFRNEFFPTLKKVLERLLECFDSLTFDVVKSITGRDWILQAF